MDSERATACPGPGIAAPSLLQRQALAAYRMADPGRTLALDLPRNRFLELLDRMDPKVGFEDPCTLWHYSPEVDHKHQGIPWASG
jgi:hypothetical protein